MRDLSSYLKSKKIDYKKLEEYGFVKENNIYTYKEKIKDGEFEALISVFDNKITSRLIDNFAGEDYVLVDIEGSVGGFVGTLREAYENIINDVIDKCLVTDAFKSSQAKEIIEFVQDKYGDNLEFLWEKFDSNAIWRNKQNDKWYAILMKVSKEKLGIKSSDEVEVLDVRYQKEDIENVVDKKLVFPGYHMNKKSWVTVILDGSLDTEKIKELISNSYELSLEKKSSQSVKELDKKVLEYLTLIPKGKVVTYKQVATYLGNKGLARVVGNILHKNPDGDKYPCYKVLNSKGELAEAFVFGGKNVQKERLEKDGIKVENGRVDLNVYQWKEI